MHTYFNTFVAKIRKYKRLFAKLDSSQQKTWLVRLCLTGLLILSLMITCLLGTVWLVERNQYNGVSPLIPTVLAAFISILLKIHKSDLNRQISIVLTLLLSGFGYFLSIGWGVDVPQALLVYSLSIIICGMLLGARAIVILFCIHGLVLTLTAILQANRVFPYHQQWKHEFVNFADGFAVTSMLAIIAMASYIFNKQIEISDEAANNYLQQLTHERNLLEKEVLKRTEQLRTAHLDRIHQLNSLAELGKTSAGMLHDMAQPVTAAFLALDDIRQHSRSKTIRDQLKLTNHALNQIEQYITAMRCSIKNSNTQNKIPLRPIIEGNCLLFSHQLRHHQIRLLIKCHQRVLFSGNSNLISSVLGNLLSNAIDACKNMPPERRVILCSAHKNKQSLIIEVTDAGCGIEESDLQFIFEPFFSRKKTDSNLGLGLSQVKNIVTTQCNGQISVRSNPMNGTTFTITLPY